MPNRIYRVDEDQEGCESCLEGLRRWETMTGPLLEQCPECSSKVHVAISPQTAPTIGAMDPRLAEGPLYMSQLADTRGRKDPDAWVSGPHSWRKRIDRAQREQGVRVLSNNEADDMRSPREIKRSERHGG